MGTVVLLIVCLLVGILLAVLLRIVEQRRINGELPEAVLRERKTQFFALVTTLLLFLLFTVVLGGDGSEAPTANTPIVTTPPTLTTQTPDTTGTTTTPTTATQTTTGAGTGCTAAAIVSTNIPGFTLTTSPTAATLTRDFPRSRSLTARSVSSASGTPITTLVAQCPPKGTSATAYAATLNTALRNQLSARLGGATLSETTTTVGPVKISGASSPTGDYVAAWSQGKLVFFVRDGSREPTTTFLQTAVPVLGAN